MIRKKDKKATEDDMDVDFVDPKQNLPPDQSPALKRNNDDDEDTFKSKLSLDKRVSEAIFEDGKKPPNGTETKSEPPQEEQTVSRRKYVNEGERKKKKRRRKIFFCFLLSVCHSFNQLTSHSLLQTSLTKTG
jgi:hypothetical protein